MRAWSRVGAPGIGKKAEPNLEGLGWEEGSGEAF